MNYGVLELKPAEQAILFESDENYSPALKGGIVRSRAPKVLVWDNYS